MKIEDLTEKDLERFWSKVDKRGEDECWNWIKFKDKDGYGNLTFRQKSYPAHRFAYYLEFGEYDDNCFVCHKCDNPSCVNPNHLFLGDSKTNVADRHIKNRDAIGSKIGTSKLLESEVSEIMRLYFNKLMKIKDIAKKFNINKSTIERIISGERWGHVVENRGIYDNGRRLTKESAEEIRNLYKQGVMQIDIAPMFNIDQSTVSNIISGRRWPSK